MGCGAHASDQWRISHFAHPVIGVRPHRPRIVSLEGRFLIESGLVPTGALSVFLDGPTLSGGSRALLRLLTGLGARARGSPSQG